MLADLKFALRSLLRAKGLALTVVVTLALGIGANAAIFSVVRGVLLRPLANRDEHRLIYIRQSAPGMGVENANFSVPEIRDLRAGVKSIAAFGDFSTIEFTMIGLGEPRTVRAGVVGGYTFARIADAYLENVRIPGTIPIVTAALVLAGAAIVASLMPAARASRVDVLRALRSE